VVLLTELFALLRLARSIRTRVRCLVPLFYRLLFAALFGPLSCDGPEDISPAHGSILFYTWGEGYYIFLLAGLILINFFLAKKMESAVGLYRSFWLILALTVDLGVLGLVRRRIR
jgi:hypothetical protein